MQGIHTHIPETNHVPREYIVTAILSLLFMVPLFLVPALVLLFFYVSTFGSMCYYYYYYYYESVSLFYYLNCLAVLMLINYAAFYCVMR